MKSRFILGFALFVVASAALAQGPAQRSEQSTPVPQQSMPDLPAPPSSGAVCFLAGTPLADGQYTTIKRLKLGKGTYGSVNEVLPPLAERARAVGADVIIEYMGSQRFGFWPWRFVRPVVRGTAVKWTGPAPLDCAAHGGFLL